MNTKQRDLAAASALSATSAAGSGQLLAGSARASDTPGRAILRAVALVATYMALAVLYTWPLASHLGQGLISPLDPLDSVWRVARGQQQLLHAPAHLFNANVFYPFNHTYLDPGRGDSRAAIPPLHAESTHDLQPGDIE